MKTLQKAFLTLTSITLVTALSSCASKNFREPEVANSNSYPTTRAYASKLDPVWEATKDAMEERNLPISQTNRDKGMIVTDWATGKSDRLFSGFGDSKIPYTIRFKFLVQLVQTGGRTTVSIKSKEEYMTDVVTSGTNFNGSVYNWVPTSSSGFKESTLLEDIGERLKPVKE
ncbi:MAG: outer membrane protein assembly factor BamC [Proteobacteria bacterium]|nr:outer membrane protein assembly factor BamC [Pseudomonadota bacterium]